MSKPLPGRPYRGPEQAPVLKAGRVYLGDNGRAFCFEHAGTMARYTGRDLSGQPVLEITPDLAREIEAQTGLPFGCEECPRPEPCRCGHAKHAAQCPAPEGCWCDSFAR